MIILSNNILDEDTTTLTTTSLPTTASYTLNNIKHSFTTKTFKTNDTTVKIVIDIGYLKEIDTLAVVGSAVDGLGFSTLFMKTNTINDFVGVNSINCSLSSINNFGYVLFTPITCRYIELTFTGINFVEVSNLYIGKSKRLLDNGFAVGSFQYTSKSKSKILENEAGQKFIDEKLSKKILKGNINHLNKAELDELLHILHQHSNTHPFWLMADIDNNLVSDGEYLFSGYFYLSKTPSFTATALGLWSCNLELEQCI